MDEEKFFAERLKRADRCPGARALLGDIRAQSDEVAHKWGAPK